MTEGCLALHRLRTCPGQARPVLRSAIENRALALLRAPVLISARNPARLIVPAIFSGNAVNQAPLALVFGNLCLYLTVDQGRKV